MASENSLKTPGARLQGDDLIGEVLRNQEEGLFRIRGKTLVPSIYRIYLNPEDFEPLRDVTPFIAEEIRHALDDKLGFWNQTRSRLAVKLLAKLAGPDSANYVRLADAWTVEILPDLDEKLAPGEIEIYSELGTPQKPEYGAGSLTRRIFPKAAAEAASPDSAEPDLSEVTKLTPASALPPAEKISAKSPVRAYLRYTDESGPKAFEVTRNQVVIGRGGRSYWVDLKLETLPDVSREHCRIRRNPETGEFTIEDVSQFGTFVDGKPAGQNVVVPLPPRAVIDLAGVIELEWEVAQT